MNIRSIFACALLLSPLLSAAPAVAQATRPEPAQPLLTPDEVNARSARFQARVDEAARALDNEPALKKFTHQQRKDLVEFVVGNMLFALAHEMGHAHVTEMGLPVLGREEDAADSYAVLLMLKMGSELSHKVLVEASKGWFLTDEREQKEGIKPAFYDEHGMNKQRAYQIACLMVGSDPDKFGDLADQVKMPEDRQGTCQGDYSNASWSWEFVLKPHLRTADMPKQKLDVVYGPATGKYGAISQAFRTIGLLDPLAEYAAERFVWRKPFQLEAQTCGQPDTHWDISVHKLLTCYEMAEDFAILYRDYVLLKDRTKDHNQ